MGKASAAIVLGLVLVAAPAISGKDNGGGNGGGNSGATIIGGL